MLRRLLRFFSSSKQPETSMILAKLNARLQPVDRGDVFEDPLAEAMQAASLGDVSGGGTLLSDDGEMVRSDIEIETTLQMAQAVPAIIELLNGMGAPKGSVLATDDGVEQPFGVAEGLAVYLNGTDLPAEVYADSDVNYVIEEAERLLGDEGFRLSHWEGPRETALYFYGASFQTMQTRLQPLLTSYALCQQCRVEQIA